MADLSKNEDDLDASNIYDLSTDEESIDDAQKHSSGTQNNSAEIQRRLAAAASKVRNHDGNLTANLSTRVSHAAEGHNHDDDGDEDDDDDDAHTHDRDYDYHERTPAVNTATHGKRDNRALAGKTDSGTLTHRTSNNEVPRHTRATDSISFFSGIGISSAPRLTDGIPKKSAIMKESRSDLGMTTTHATIRRTGHGKDSTPSATDTTLLHTANRQKKPREHVPATARKSSSTPPRPRPHKHRGQPTVSAGNVGRETLPSPQRHGRALGGGTRSGGGGGVSPRATRARDGAATDGARQVLSMSMSAPHITVQDHRFPQDTGSNELFAPASTARASPRGRTPRTPLTASLPLASSGGVGGDANDSLELDEILARWKEAVEQCMSRDKLRISDVFRRFDKDADGRLSLEEFTQGVEMLAVTSLAYTDVATLFAYMDPDGNGHVLFSEFSKGLQYRHRKQEPGSVTLGSDGQHLSGGGSLSATPLQSPHRKCGCLTLPNNNSAKAVRALGGQDTVRGATGMADASTIVHHRGTTGTTPRARRELSLGERSRPPVASDETLGLSLELADLSVHPDVSDAARRTEERTRGNAQRAPPPTGNTTVFDDLGDSHAAAATAALADFGMQESAVAVDELTAQIAVQDKLLQVLSTREANIADKITDTERKLTAIKREKSAANKELKGHKEQLMKMTGHFTADGAKVKQQIRDNIKRAESRVAKLGATQAQLQHELHRLAGGRDQVQALRDRISASQDSRHAHRQTLVADVDPTGSLLGTRVGGAGASHGTAPSLADVLEAQIAIHGHLADELADKEQTLTQKQKQLELVGAVVARETAQAHTDLAAAQKRLDTLSGRLGAESGRLKQQQRDAVAALQAHIKRLNARAKENAVEQQRTAGALEQIRLLRETVAVAGRDREALRHSIMQHSQAAGTFVSGSSTSPTARPTVSPMATQLLKSELRQSVGHINARLDQLSAHLSSPRGSAPPETAATTATTSGGSNARDATDALAQSLSAMHSRLDTHLAAAVAPPPPTVPSTGGGGDEATSTAVQQSLAALSNKLDAVVQHATSNRSNSAVRPYTGNESPEVPSPSLNAPTLDTTPAGLGAGLPTLTAPPHTPTHTPPADLPRPSSAERLLGRIVENALLQHQPPPPTLLHHTTAWPAGGDASMPQTATMATMGLVSTEAALIKQAAEADARSMRARADLDATTIRDNAQRDVLLTKDAAQREAHDIVEAARRDAERVRRDAEAAAQRRLAESDNRVARRVAEEDEHTSRIARARTELQDVQGKLLATRLRLDDETAQVLASERGKFHEQMTGVQQALVRDREALEADMRAREERLEAEMQQREQALLQAQEQFQAEMDATRHRVADDVAQLHADTDAELQERSDAFSHEVEAMRHAMADELEAQRREWDAQRALEQQRGLASLATDKALLQQQLEDLRRQLDQDAALGRERIAAEHTAAQVQLEADRTHARALLEKESEAVHATLAQTEEHAKHRLAAQLEAMHTAANADMQARQQAVEQEVKLLEEQIRSEMETSEDGAHLYRLHRQVKFHKELAIDTHRKRNAAEERCRELDGENTSNLARIAQLQDMVAQLEGAKLDLTAQLRDALADTDAAEADKNVVTKSLEAVRRDRDELSAQLQTTEQAVALQTSRADQAENNAAELRDRLACAFDDVVAKNDALQEYVHADALATQLAAARATTERDVDAELTRMQRDLDRVRSEAAQAQDQAAVAARELAEATQESHRIAEALREVRADGQRLGTERDAAVRDATAAVAALEAERGATRKKEREHERVCNDLRNKCDNLGSRVAQLQDAALRGGSGLSSSSAALGGGGRGSTEGVADERLKAEVHDLRGKVKDARRELETQRLLATELQRKVDAARAESEDARADRAQMSTTIARLEQELLCARRELDDKTDTVAQRTRAADDMQRNFTSTIDKIRTQAEKDVVDVTDRLRAVQTQLRARDDRVRELEGTLGHLRDQLATAQADAQATATALQQRERDVEHSNTALERARSEHHTQVQELRDQANRANATAEQLAAAVRLHQDESAHAAREAASLRALNKENTDRLKEHEDELRRLQGGPSEDHFRQVLGLLENTTKSKDALAAHLDQTYRKNHALQESVAQLRTTGDSYATRLGRAQDDAHTARQRQRDSLALWAGESARRHGIQDSVAQLRKTVASVQTGEAAIAGHLDELANANHDLRQSLKTGNDTSALLASRLASVEQRVDATRHELDADRSTTQAQYQQLATTASALEQSQRNSARSASTAARMAARALDADARTRDRDKVLQAYAEEVGDQRAEIASLRGQLGTSDAQAILLNGSRSLGPLQASNLR